MYSFANRQQGIHSRPLLATVGFHILLLLALVLWRFSIPAKTESIPDMGIEVNLGTSPDGSGTDQPMDVEDPAATAVNVSGNSVSAASADHDIERSNDEESPSVAAEPSNRAQHTVSIPVRNRTNNQTAPAAVVRTTPAPRPRYVYPGNSGRGGNSASTNRPGTGEGNTSGNGDRGVPGGTPGASNYTGNPGTGTGGISFKLDGRNIVAFPPKEARFREGGRVVVRVTVDRNGEIVNKQIVSSTNTELSPIALKKLSLVRFNKSESAPAEQFGNITFEFKTRQ